MEKEILSRSLNELRWALQALALPADAQRGLFPSFVCVADELALDFDHWRETATGHHASTAERLSALASVDALLSRMSGEKNAELWTDAALANDPRWQELRERAQQALRAFGWTLETPPTDRAVYVQ